LVLKKFLANYPPMMIKSIGSMLIFLLNKKMMIIEPIDLVIVVG
jgi:hypothetical protein